MGTHNLTLVSEHRGEYGDFEFYTVASGVSLPNYFYATSSDIWVVTSVEAAANISVGEPVAFFSRQQNARRSGYVDAVSVSATASGVTVYDLVRMDRNISVSGDSGAGWSWGGNAFGIHKGLCSLKSCFSKAANLLPALYRSIWTGS